MMHAHDRHQGQGWQPAQWWDMWVESLGGDKIKTKGNTKNQDSYRDGGEQMEAEVVKWVE